MALVAGTSSTETPGTVEVSAPRVRDMLDAVREDGGWTVDENL